MEKRCQNIAKKYVGRIGELMEIFEDSVASDIDKNEKKKRHEH